MISQGAYVYRVHQFLKKKFGFWGEDEERKTRKAIAALAHVWQATRRTHNAATITMPAKNVTHAQFGWFDDM